MNNTVSEANKGQIVTAKSRTGQKIHFAPVGSTTAFCGARVVVTVPNGTVTCGACCFGAK